MSKDGTWSKPEIASFSGVYHEGYPKMSPDGERIYFYSKRPFKEGGRVRKDSQIFFVKRRNNGWSKPIRLIIPEGLGIGNYPSHFGKDGCFYVRSKMGKQDYKIFKGYIIGNKFESVVQMDKPVTFDPREEYLIQNIVDWKTIGITFEIAFKKKDGSWTRSRSMGDTINTNQTQSRFPGFSPDGKYFFFSSYRSGYEKIYWVSREFFEVCRKNDLNLVVSLYEVLENKGIEALRKQLKIMKNKLSFCYPFSKQLLNGVAYRLLAKGKKDNIQKVLKLNFSLYPEEFFFIEQLLLSVLKNDKKLFMKCKKNINKAHKRLNENLLDKINVLAYDILNGGFTEEAIKVYKLNTELFPGSSKVFDRLGRAYSGIKKRKEAVIAYKKALELDPENQNAINALKKS